MLNCQIKKFIKIISFVLVISSIMIIDNKIILASNNDTKRIISIAYDDSASMNSNSQDYAYASFALQNMIGLMNKDDKLNIVKMSNIENNVLVNVSDYIKRKNAIAEVKKYDALGDRTTFKIVDKAVEYLYEQKNIYGNDTNYQYYLLILTDGQFQDYPEDMHVYLNNINNKFKNLSYNTIVVGIGNDVPIKLRNDIIKEKNNYYVKCGNNEEIVKGVLAAHNIMYNREILPDKQIAYSNNNSSVSLMLNGTARKIIVFEQDQKNPVVNVKNNKLDTDSNISFLCEKLNSPYINTYISHNSFLNDTIKDKVDIEFLDNVNIAKNKFTVLVEYITKNKKVNSDNNIADEEPIVPVTTTKDEGGGLFDADISIDGPGPDPEPIVPTEPFPDDPTIETTVPITQTETSIIETEPTIPTIPGPTPPHIITNDKFPWWLLLLLLLTTGSFIFWPHICSSFLHNGIDDYRNNIGLRIARFLHIPIILFLLLLLFPYLGCSRIGGGWPHPITWEFRKEPIRFLPYPIVWFNIVPFLILGLILGYIIKPRFDKKWHDIQVKDGNKFIDDGSMIQVKNYSKFIPYIAERGTGYDMPIKACFKKDRIKVDKYFLNKDVLIEGKKIDNVNKAYLYDNMKLTKNVNGKNIDYIYRYVPYFEKDK